MIYSYLQNRILIISNTIKKSLYNNKKLFSDFFSVISGATISRFFSFISSILIARWFGAESFGIYMFYFVISTLTWQFSQAFDITFIKQSKSNKNFSNEIAYLQASLSLKLIFHVIAFITILLIAEIVTHNIINKPELKAPLILGIVSGCGVSYLRTHAALYQFKEQFGLYSINYLIYSFSIFSTLCFSKFAFPDISIISLIYTFTIISIIIGFLSLVKLYQLFVKNILVNLSIIADSIHFGKWVLGATLLNRLFARLDLLFLTYFVSYQDVGIYSVAAQVTLALSLLAGPMSGLYLPKSIKAASSKQHLNQYYNEIKYPVLFIIILCIVTAFFSPLIINLFFGNEYSQAIIVTRVLLIGMIFQVLYQPIQFLFYGIDKINILFALELLKVTSFSVLLFILVPFFGIKGAASAICIVSILHFLLTCIIFKRLIK